MVHLYHKYHVLIVSNKLRLDLFFMEMSTAQKVNEMVKY